MRLLLIIVLTLSVPLLNSLAAQSVHTPLRKGDRAYDRAAYKTAEKQYRIAADRDMGNHQAVYNLGNTLYLEGNFEDAAQRFQQLATTEQNPALRADALHNLGDAYLKMRKYKESVQAYEQSLRLRPADAGTKQNLQMAKKRLKEEEQKEKEKQQQQQQQQQNQDPNQQNQSQQDPKNQQDKQQNKPQDSNQQPPPEQQNQQQQEQQQKQAQQQLKKEEAKRLLETAIEKDDRKNARKYRSVQPKPDQKKPKKDW